MNDSKFNLWRICFAFCHVDFEVCGEEKNWMEDKLSTLKLNAKQEAVLRQDMKAPPAIMPLLELITHPADRSFLTYQLRVLASLDKEFSDSEKEKLKKISDYVFSKSNFDEASELIQKMEIESYHEDNVYEISNKHSLFESMINKFLRFINPGDYKFPRH